MSVMNCIANLAKTGKISEKQRKQAEDLYQGIVGHLYETMPRASAEAHAALETARILEEGAKARRYALAKDAIAQAEAKNRIDQHENGPIAGFMGVLSRDIRQKGGINVESVAKDYHGQMQTTMRKVIDAYSSKWAGLKQDTAGIRDVIRENFGVDTHNPIAKAASEGWQAATKFASERAQELGKVFSPADDWRQPQFWESSRAHKFGKREFLSDIEGEIRNGGLQVFDPDTYAPANALRQREILDNAAQKIIEDSSLGLSHGGAFRTDMRIFRFSDGEHGAESYLKLMDKYGAGQGGYLQMMQAHVESTSRELGLMHVLGPGYRTNGEALLRYAQQQASSIKANAEPIRTWGDWFKQAPGKIGKGSIGFLESPAKAEHLWKYLSGQYSGAQNRLMADIFAGTRAFMSAANLGSAMITAVPSDSVNWMMAAQHDGLDAGRLASRIAQSMGDDPSYRDSAARLGIVSQSASDHALGAKRFGDQFLGEKLMQRMASFVIRAQGLHAWDAAMKSAFPMEFLASIGDRAGKGFDDLDVPFKDFLQHYRFTPEEWSTLANPANNIDMGGAKFVLPDAIEKENPRLRTKLMSAIYDERQFAYLAEGSARVRAITGGGAKAGTLGGELARSAFLFKNYPMSMISTWGTRAALDAGWEGRAALAAKMGIYMTAAGALTIQAKSILEGRDPREMKNPVFWAESALQGGALGIYGDFFNSAFSRASTSLPETLMGPLAQIPAAIQDVTSSARRVAEGGNANLGAAVARDVRNFTPGGTLWYARLMFNRLLMDQFQKLIDPNYAASFRREEANAQKAQQQYWWNPGTTEPQRAPDMGAAVR